MALNINPQDRDGTHEIANLVYWSIPLLQGVSVLLFLIGVQHIVFYFDNAIRLTLSFAFILAALNLVSLFRSEKNYITTEKEADLAQILSSLGSFWKTYSVILIFSLGSLIQMAGKGGIYYVVPPVVALLLFWSFSQERKQMTGIEDLTKCISRYAALNLGRVRFVAFFAIGVGATFLILYVLSFFVTISISETTCLLWSFSYLGIGTGAGLYWKKVKDIHRNPSVIYFERSLERLNLYWLIFLSFSLLQFVANFF